MARLSPDLACTREKTSLHSEDEVKATDASSSLGNEPRMMSDCEADKEQDATENPDVSSLEESPEYPEGARLIAVVISLFLSTFLVSLDMVSELQTRSPQN